MNEEILKIVELASQNKAKYQFYSEEETIEEKQINEENHPTSSNSNSEHDGKYFVIQRGKAECNVHIEAARSSFFGSTRIDPEQFMKTKFDETKKGNPL